jgi:hypothetical protein
MHEDCIRSDRGASLSWRPFRQQRVSCRGIHDADLGPAFAIPCPPSKPLFERYEVRQFLRMDS